MTADVGAEFLLSVGLLEKASACDDRECHGALDGSRFSVRERSSVRRRRRGTDSRVYSRSHTVPTTPDSFDPSISFARMLP